VGHRSFLPAPRTININIETEKKKKEGRKGKRTKKKEGKRKERFDRASQTTTGLAVFPTAPSHALAASGRAAEHARGGSRQASRFQP
jgi:hypothetical protein